MPTFTPPSYEEGMPVRTKPLRYYRYTRSLSVVRIAGVLTSIRVPTAAQLTAAGAEGVDWFLGGHEYQISVDTADELTAAGFTVEG